MQDITLFIQHHHTLAILFALLLILIAFIELIRFKRGGQRLTPSQLTHMINHAQAAVIDLRPAEQFAKGHIIGALSLPLNTFKEKARKLEKLKNRPLVLVCVKGLEAAKLTTQLKAEGYQVHLLGGGMNAWLSADLPVVKDSDK